MDIYCQRKEHVIELFHSMDHKTNTKKKNLQLVDQYNNRYITISIVQ